MNLHNSNGKIKFLDKCTICLEECNLNKEKIIKLDCGHFFHYDCITKLKKHNCPNCREKIYNENLCNSQHVMQFYTPFYNKQGICRFCNKKSLKEYMKNNLFKLDINIKPNMHLTKKGYRKITLI